MRCLIVDDEPTARNVLKNHVKKLIPSCEIIEAQNGADAIYHYFHKKPDVVLLDLLMPVVSGEVFLNIIEDLHRRKFIKAEPRVIVITSFTDAAELVKISSRPSVETVIPKPITNATVAQLKSFLL